MAHRLDLIAHTAAEGRLELRSPGVGLFTCSLLPGQVVTPGMVAGTLIALGAVTLLVAPAGALGRIVSPRPDRVREPVGYGQLVYELAPLDGALGTFEAVAGAQTTTDQGGLFVRAPHSGRFWQRAAPGEPPLVAVNAVVERGQAIGLIEVMKTFSHVRYEPSGELPPRARVLCIVVGDGAEVSEGAPLLEVEPA
jgi:acetyl-CoA carboxylase biotin carboxyl carrier protein